MEELGNRASKNDHKTTRLSVKKLRKKIQKVQSYLILLHTWIILIFGQLEKITKYKAI